MNVRPCYQSVRPWPLITALSFCSQKESSHTVNQVKEISAPVGTFHFIYFFFLQKNNCIIAQNGQPAQ